MIGIVESIDHFVLYSGDSERTIAFYRDVLGIETRYEQDWREGKRPVFSLVVNDRQTISVHPAGSEVHPRARDAAVGAVDVCFLTSLSPEEVAAHLNRHGVEIVHGPMRNRTSDSRPSHSIYFRDGDGNLVELMSPDR